MRVQNRVTSSYYQKLLITNCAHGTHNTFEKKWKNIYPTVYAWEIGIINISIPFSAAPPVTHSIQCIHTDPHNLDAPTVDPQYPNPI